MTRRAWAFAGVVAAMVAVPLASIAWSEWKLATGDDIRLRVEPVDPLDFFRGEYVALQYPISRVRLDRARWQPGDSVYVPLRRVDGHWTGERGYRDKPATGTFIRGRFRDGGVEYGIETFFVEEGQARRYENAMADGRLYADVVLDDDGGARLKDLVIRRE